MAISEETRKKMSESAKRRAAKGILPNNKGKIPWNKGLCAETDERVASYAEKQKGQKRSGNWSPQYHWQGEGNPWFGKSRKGKSSPRWVDHRHEREYWDFYNKVIWQTEKTYKEYKSEINPNNYSRTLCGVEDGYQLDHIIPIDYGWKNKMTIEELSKKENLQMLPWQTNRKKSNLVDIS